MSNQNVYQLITNFCKLKNLTVPTVAFGSTDQTIVQALQLLTSGVAEIADKADWKCMQKTTPLFAHANGDGGMALDISRQLQDFKWITPGTIYETTARVPVYGPVGEQERAYMMMQQVTPAQYAFWFGPGLMGQEALYIYPYNANARFQFSYQSLYPWVDSTGGPFGQPPGPGSTVPFPMKEYPTLDSDFCVFPSRIVQADLGWRWSYKKGFPYAEEKAAADKMLANLDSAEAGAGALNLAGSHAYPQVVGPGLLIAAGSWRLP